MKKKNYISLILILLFYITNCSSTENTDMLLYEYKRAGASQEIIHKQEEAIERYYQNLENEYENEQQMENTNLKLDNLSLNIGDTIILINSTFNLQTNTINDQVNKLEKDISTLLSEKNIDVISTPSDKMIEYTVDLNCYYNEITHIFMKIDVTILKKGKYHGQFSIDLDQDANRKEKIMPIGDLSQICSETIYLLLTK